MYYTLQQTARLLLAEASIESLSGNYIYDAEELEEKFGIRTQDEIQAVVDTINQLYPDVLLDDPGSNSEPGELSLMLALAATENYWLDQPTIEHEWASYLAAMQGLYENFNKVRSLRRSLQKAKVLLSVSDRQAEEYERRAA